MKKLDPTDLKPCSFMTGLISAHVDGNLSGVAEWYTLSHIKGCKQCQASIPFLHALKDRLVELNVVQDEPAELSSERLEAIAQGLAKIDAEAHLP